MLKKFECFKIAILQALKSNTVEPKAARYLTLILLSFGSLVILIFGSILSGVIYHRLIFG